MTRKWTVLLFVLLLPFAVMAADSFQFVQLSDPQFGRGGYLSDVARLRQAVRQINKQDPDLVLVCGDLVDITENTKGYAELKEVLGGLVCPFHMVPGNHDVGDPADAKALAQYRKTIGRDYFDFDHQGVQLVTAVSTSLNRDANSLGYRLWTVDEQGGLLHEFVALEDGAWNAGPTVLVEVRGLKPGETAQVVLLMGDWRDVEWDLSNVRKIELKTVNKGYLSNATPETQLKLLKEGEATVLVRSFFTTEDGGIDGLRFGARRFVAQSDANNKVVIELRDETVATYTNPLDVPVADPFVYEEAGVYYLYGTDDVRGSEYGFPVLTSIDLVNWEYRGSCFEKDETTWTQCNYWGPEMAKVGDTYYFYFNGSPNEKPGWPFNMHLCIAKADSPLGPFKEFKVPFYKPEAPAEAIDQNIFIDDDGTAYLIFTQVIQGRNDIRVVKLKDNLVEFDGEPTMGTVPTQAWESRPWDGHLVNEGGFMFKHNGYYYLTYTGNHFLDPHYSIGYATSKNPLGPWEKHEGNPILSKTETVHGPGNGMFVKSPDGTELFIVYHTHFKPGQVGPRKVAIDRVRFQTVENGPDILIVDGPTSTPQPMPSGAR